MVVASRLGQARWPELSEASSSDFLRRVQRAAPMTVTNVLTNNGIQVLQAWQKTKFEFFVKRVDNRRVLTPKGP